MSKPVESRRTPNIHTEHIKIQIKGNLGPSWSDFFGGLKVTNSQSGETVLVGPIVDQAELHGILARIRDLNLMLISVSCTESEYQANDDHNGNV